MHIDVSSHGLEFAPLGFCRNIVFSPITRVHYCTCQVPCWCNFINTRSHPYFCQHHIACFPFDFHQGGTKRLTLQGSRPLSELCGLCIARYPWLPPLPTTACFSPQFALLYGRAGCCCLLQECGGAMTPSVSPAQYFVLMIISDNAATGQPTATFRCRHCTGNVFET